MSEIDKMIKIVDGILGDDDLCEGCEYVIEGLSCAECRRKYADKIIKILRDVKHKPQTCDTCRFELYCPEMCKGCCEWDSHYEPKDEPQTDYTPDCPFCKRYGTEECLGSDCRHYKTYKDEQSGKERL